MSTDPLTTILNNLTSIDTASAAIQLVVGTYPSGTAGLATVENILSTINTSTASLRAMIAAAQGGTTPPPAPAPSPTPTPTPTPGSGSGLSPTRMIGDDFTGYGGQTANLMKAITTNIGGSGSPATALYTDGANPKQATIDTTVLYNGHPTMKYSQPGGTDKSPELWVTLPKPIDHLWFRAKIRFSTGFTTTGVTPNAAAAYKLLGWAHTGYDGSGRLEITNTNQYQLYWNIQSKSGGALVGGGGYGIAGNIAQEWTSGAWYDYIIEVDRVGKVIRCWITPDGQTPVLRVTEPETMKDGSAMPQVSGVMLGLNFNQVRASGQTQALWYGNWTVVDGAAHPNPFGL